jgi:hypothetical protein
VGKTNLPRGMNPDYKPGPPGWRLSIRPTTLSREKRVTKPHDEPRRDSGGELSRKLRPTAGCDAKEEEEEYIVYYLILEHFTHIILFRTHFVLERWALRY